MLVTEVTESRHSFDVWILIAILSILIAISCLLIFSADEFFDKIAGVALVLAISIFSALMMPAYLNSVVRRRWYNYTGVLIDIDKSALREIAKDYKIEVEKDCYTFSGSSLMSDDFKTKYKIIFTTDAQKAENNIKENLN